MSASRFHFLLVACLLTGCTTTSHQASPGPCITSAVHFVGRTLDAGNNPTELNGFWSSKLQIGTTDEDSYNFLTVNINGQQQRIRVETCQQYTNAINQGAYALTTADMATESWFRRATATLTFLEKAQASRNPLPAHYLQQLPVSILAWNDSDQEAQIRADAKVGRTLKDYTRSGRLKKFRPQRNTVSFDDEFRHYSIEELAHGDHDGDGLEDALLLVSWRYIGGSGRGYEAWIAHGNGGLQPFQGI